MPASFTLLCIVSGLDPAVKEYVDQALSRKNPRNSAAGGSVSRSDLFHSIEEDEENYVPFDIAADLCDQLDPSLVIPAVDDPMFSNTNLPERSVKPTKKGKKSKVVGMC